MREAGEMARTREAERREFERQVSVIADRFVASRRCMANPPAAPDAPVRLSDWDTPEQVRAKVSEWARSALLTDVARLAGAGA